jgi:hypothetical protein
MFAANLEENLAALMRERPHCDNGEGVAGLPRPLPYPLREPQWLGTKSTPRRKGEAMKGG